MMPGHGDAWRVTLSFTKPADTLPEARPLFASCVIIGDLLKLEAHFLALQAARRHLYRRGSATDNIKALANTRNLDGSGSQVSSLLKKNVAAAWTPIYELAFSVMGATFFSNQVAERRTSVAGLVEIV